MSNEERGEILYAKQINCTRFFAVAQEIVSPCGWNGRRGGKCYSPLKRGIVSLQILCNNKSTGPGPLKIITAQPTGNIHALTAKKQAGDLFAFQGFG